MNVLYTTCAALLIALAEWRNLTDSRTKTIFTVMLAAVWLLSLVLLFDRDLPGPQQFIEFVLEPLASFLAKLTHSSSMS
ncbi:hypothetical protein [Paenibacillus sp. NPDC058071]|uniref:hypothetical protein n=1 Tax=Paenibacillus sp. NPDC058071 TaxID=3346326 RepID=UPI0036D855EF